MQKGSSAEDRAALFAFARQRLNLIQRYFQEKLFNMDKN
jgi:hypothetical protein